MKKTILALAVAGLAASAANAATVYENEGSKVEVGGSVRLLLQKQTDNRTDLKDKGSRVVVKGTQDLGNGLSALGNVEVRFTKDGDIGDQIHTKRLYAGFNYDNVGLLTFGRQLTNGDDLGLSDYTYDLGGINKVSDAGDKVIHFRSADFNGFSFGADYIFGNADKSQDNNSAFVVAGFYKQKFGDLGVAVDVGYSQDNRGAADAVAATATTAAVPASEKHKEKAFTVGTEISYDKFAVAVDYSQRKATKDSTISWRTTDADANGRVIKTPFNKVQEVEVGVKYQFLDNAKVYGDYIWGKATYPNAAEEPVKLHAFMAGVDYEIHKNVVTYLEGGHFRYKQDGETFRRENKVGLGLRVFF